MRGRKRAYWPIATVIALSSFAAFSASAALRTPTLWPKKEIEFVICTVEDADLTGLKECKTRRPLDGVMTRRFRDAVAEWNRIFAGHIELREINIWRADVAKVSAPRLGEQGTCSVNWAGYMSGSVSEVTIGSQCNRKPITPIGTILHEIGHLVGLHHEQRRPDRDDYLVLNLEPLNEYANTPVGQKDWQERRNAAYQYTKICDPYASGECSIGFGPSLGPVAPYSKDYGLAEGPYDFDSIMHYSIRLFETGQPLTGVTAVGALRMQEQGVSIGGVGQRDRLSAGDITAIKAMYPRN